MTVQRAHAWMNCPSAGRVRVRRAGGINSSIALAATRCERAWQAPLANVVARARLRRAAPRRRGRWIAKLRLIAGARSGALRNDGRVRFAHAANGPRRTVRRARTLERHARVLALLRVGRSGTGRALQTPEGCGRAAAAPVREAADVGRQRTGAVAAWDRRGVPARARPAVGSAALASSSTTVRSSAARRRTRFVAGARTTGSAIDVADEVDARCTAACDSAREKSKRRATQKTRRACEGHGI